jgi:hypothetical protein
LLELQRYRGQWGLTNEVFWGVAIERKSLNSFLNWTKTTQKKFPCTYSGIG